MENIFESPKYVAAVEHERTVRDSAFLNLNESISGFEVVPLTLRKLIIVRMMKSPLLYGGLPSPMELAAFLWALNPGYSTGNNSGRNKFMRDCRKRFFPPSIPRWKNLWTGYWFCQRQKAIEIEAAKIIDAAIAYISEAFMDKGGSKSSGKNVMDYYSDASFICVRIAQETGWSDEVILDMPLKRVFQYFNVLKKYHNPNVPLFNPSDRILGELAANLNSKN